jgi:hypothetical protein
MPTTAKNASAITTAYEIDSCAISRTRIAADCRADFIDKLVDDIDARNGGLKPIPFNY